MSKILKVIKDKEILNPPPIWIMRQAGRYLPEYMQIRSQFNDFLSMCYNPKIASQITLQPIDRFDLDAAIIFSDILVIPDALGFDVGFEKGKGPVLEKFTNEKSLTKLKVENVLSFLTPVFENIKITRSKLDKSKSLIGFSGSPFTLACYMIEGGSSKNFENTRRFAVEKSQLFSQLMDILTQAIIVYLIEQIKSGVDIVKLFDSWAGILPPSEFEKWVIAPNKKIVNEVKKSCQDTPVICFPKGSGTMYPDFIDSVQCDVLAVDQILTDDFINNQLQSKITIQGNFDNFLLAYGTQEQISQRVDVMMQKFSKKPFVFNLGHGIIKDTPIENVEFLIKKIRNEI